MDDRDKALALIAGKIEDLLEDAVGEELPFVLILPGEKIRVCSNMPQDMISNLIEVMVENKPSKGICCAVDIEKGTVDVNVNAEGNFVH